MKNASSISGKFLFPGIWTRVSAPCETQTHPSQKLLLATAKDGRISAFETSKHCIEHSSVCCANAVWKENERHPCCLKNTYCWKNQAQQRNLVSSAGLLCRIILPETKHNTYQYNLPFVYTTNMHAENYVCCYPTELIIMY